MSRGLTLAGYAVIAGAALTFEIAGRLHHHSPTLTETVLVVTRRPALRAVVLAGWLWLGWHFFARGPG